MIRFSDDDASYLAWLTAHPNGFVVNVRRSPDPDYVALHRASCKSISSDKRRPGAYTARGYRKVCGITEAELKLAAKSEGRSDGSFSRRCGLCCSVQP